MDSRAIQVIQCCNKRIRLHPVAIFSGNRQCSSEEEGWKEIVKSCCAVGSANRYSKSAGIPFDRFPTETERKRTWIAAVNRKDLAPSEYSWICAW